MIKIGHYNKLRIERIVDFGAYLDGGNGVSILLPVRYMNDEMKPGDEVDVFIYNDSEDRLIATTEHPFATVGQFAFLQVTAVTRYGAFLDWGLPKDLLVPFREQRVKMKEGGIYPVYIYLDDASKRVVASAKIEKFIGNRFPDLKHGDEVEILPYSHNEIGYKAIVNDLYYGILYDNELYSPVTLGEHRTAWVNRVRDDGKIDLMASPGQRHRVNSLTDTIMTMLSEHDGSLPYSDHSSPEVIKDTFNCSKKDFKKALGQLYKEHKIAIHETGITTV